MAFKTGNSSRTIEKKIAKLHEIDILFSEGADLCGYWHISNSTITAYGFPIHTICSDHRHSTQIQHAQAEELGTQNCLTGKRVNKVDILVTHQHEKQQDLQNQELE